MLRYTFDFSRNRTNAAKSSLPLADSVEAFDSPNLAHQRLSNAGSDIVVVAERFSVGEAIAAIKAGEPLSTFTGCDAIAVELNTNASPSAISVTRSQGGSSPVYVSSHKTLFSCSWRYEDVVGTLKNPEPNIENCRLFLTKGPSQTRNQPVAGTAALWPGETVEFDGAELNHHSAPQIPISTENLFSIDARATDEFIRLIGDVANKRSQYSSNVLCEYSGGLDSGCVALACKTANIDFSTYAIIINGMAGAQQRKRRQEFKILFGVSDFTVPANVENIFQAALGRDRNFSVYEDPYGTPSQRLFEDLRKRGLAPDLLLTGIGGDELFMAKTTERENYEVPGAISSSSITASWGRSELFMRQGMWVSHPLSDFSVCEFTRQLPPSIAIEKRLEMLALARAGFSDGYLFPPIREHFGGVCTHDLQHFDFQAYFRNSIVGDYAIADPVKCIKSASDHLGQGYSPDTAIRLFFLVQLESILRRYLG